MSSGETRNQPGSDGIEKRSKLQELEQPEAKRSRPSSWQVSAAPPEPKDDLLQYPVSTLDDFGLSFDPKWKNLVLYRRESVNTLFRFLYDGLNARRRVSSRNQNPYSVSWILGPPGVGKSTAVIGFIRSERSVSEWAVTWIHCLDGGKQFSSRHRDKTGEKIHLDKTGEKIDEFMSDDYRKHLAELNVGNQQHLLVLDGYTNATDATMLAASNAWLRRKFEKRRLVVVCSMASRGKSNEADDTNMDVKEFTLCSWTLEEYKAAASKLELYDEVKEKLGKDADKTKDELLESKYYFAGGSARFMFQKTTDEVKARMAKALAKVPDVQTFAAGMAGSLSTNFVHGLVSIHGEVQGTVIQGIVSQYAGNRLAAILGTRLVDHFTDLYMPQLSPPMKGSLFEMWFFAKLSKEGLSYEIIGGGEGDPWPKSVPVEMPSNNEELCPTSPTWFQPAWNNGGFDAVYVDPHTQTVRFVQITLNSHHSFKIHFFKNFLGRLTPHMPVETLKIFFVYPKGSGSPNKPVTTGEGGLSPFNWAQGKEREDGLIPFNWAQGKEWEKVTKVTLKWPGF